MKELVTLLVILHCSVFQAQEASTLQTDHSNEVPDTEMLVHSQSNDSTYSVCPLNTCSGLLKDFGSMEAQLQAMEIRLSGCELKAEKLATLEDNLEATRIELESLKSQLRALGSQIEDLKQNEEQPKVAFSASIGGHGYTGPFNTDITLVFRNVLTNIGSAYNPDTGIFSAPRKGIYYISLFYHSGTENPTILSLFKNGQRIATASHHRGEGGPENGSNGVSLLLEAGDHLYIVLWAGSWVWDGNNIDTIFSGFLLTPL